MAMPTQGERIRSLELGLQQVAEKVEYVHATGSADRREIRERLDDQETRLRKLEIEFAALSERNRHFEKLVEKFIDRRWQIFLALVTAGLAFAAGYLSK